MANKKEPSIESMVNSAKKQRYEYMIGEKKVSEFKFMQLLNREMKERRGEKIRKTFHWTDQKVIDCFKMIEIEVTPEVLKRMKNLLD